MVLDRSWRSECSLPRSVYSVPSRSMWKAAVNIEAATARMAFFGAATGLDAQELSSQVAGLDAHCSPGGVDQGCLIQVPLSRSRVERRLPALSSLRGHRPAQEMRWPAVGKRDMSTPISATTTLAVRSLTPGIVVSRRAHCWIGSSAFPTVASSSTRVRCSASTTCRCSASVRPSHIESRGPAQDACVHEQMRGHMDTTAGAWRFNDRYLADSVHSTAAAEGQPD